MDAAFNATTHNGINHHLTKYEIQIETYDTVKDMFALHIREGMSTIGFV